MEPKIGDGNFFDTESISCSIMGRPNVHEIILRNLGQKSSLVNPECVMWDPRANLRIGGNRPQERSTANFGRKTVVSVGATRHSSPPMLYLEKY